MAAGGSRAEAPAHDGAKPAQPDTEHAVLSARGLRQTFGSHVVLDAVDLRLAAGSVTVVLGENGAGKSTLLRTLACELPLSAGALHVGGQDAVATPELAAQQLIHVAQHPPLAAQLTPREHLDALLAFRQLDPAQASARVAVAADALRITAVLDRPVRALSGGTQHKVALLLALVARPPVVLLDEPHAGLDVRSALALRALIRSARDEGTAFLLASHLAEATLAVADRALVLARGQWTLDLDRAALDAFAGDARALETAVLAAMG